MITYIVKYYKIILWLLLGLIFAGLLLYTKVSITNSSKAKIEEAKTIERTNIQREHTDKSLKDIRDKARDLLKGIDNDENTTDYIKPNTTYHL